MVNLNERSYDSIELEETFGFEKTISEDDLKKFSDLTGDFNPLHCDDNYAKSQGFQSKVAQGMLISGFFSTLVGMICPGKRNLYLSQDSNFKKPIYPGDSISVKGKVINKIDSIKVLVIKTEIYVKEHLCVEGQAKVKVI